MRWAKVRQPETDQLLPSIHSTADRGEDDQIGGLPTRTASLALEDAELVAKGRDFGLKFGIALPSGHDQLDQEPGPANREQSGSWNR